MQLRIPRIVIAGATSGVGKTSITCSIIMVYKKRVLLFNHLRLDQIISIQVTYQVFQNMKLSI